MKKEEFLAMSLPYRLKIDIIYHNGSNDSKSTNLIATDLDREIEYEIIPILRPLSYITKPIEHNGEKFIPINKLKTYFGWAYLWGCYKKRETINVYAIPYACLSKLIEWHFDIAGLIEKGEAIDINTLTENPYK